MIYSPRKKEITLTVILDFLMLLLGWSILYYYDTGPWNTYIDEPGLSKYWIGFVLAAYWIVFFAVFGLYKKLYLISRFDEFIKLAKFTILGTLILFFAVFSAGHELFVEARNQTFWYWLVNLLTVATGRFVIRSLQRYYAKKGKGLHQALIIGTGPTAYTAYEDLLRNRILGMKVVGFVRVNGPESANPSSSEVDESMLIGKLSNLRNLVRKYAIQDIIVALEPGQRHDLLEILNRIDIPEITVKILPDFYQLVNGLNKTNQIFGLPLIEISPDPMPMWAKVVKRGLDIFVSALVLIVTSPLILILAILVRATSKGPAIYKQTRVGRNFNTFTMFKFRTMYDDAESKSGPTWVSDNDSRITPLGGWLRKLRLDELPQFLNVLKGEMSLVGPRPERPYFVEQFKKQIPLYSRRLRVRPGITGWAQVKWKYDASLQDVKEKTKYDLFYVENMSLTMDFKIIINTLMTVIRAKGK